MSDLITRLSAELDRREFLATAANDGTWKRWATQTGHHPVGVNTRDVGIDVYAPDLGRAVDVVAYLDSANPTDELRLIEAHRGIVDDAQYAWERRDKSPSWYLKATALRGVLLRLAEGYGLTTEEGT